MSKIAELQTFSATVDKILYEDYESIKPSLLSTYLNIADEKINYPDEKEIVRSGIGTFQTVTPYDQFDEMRTEFLGSKTPNPEIFQGKISISRQDMAYPTWKAEKEREAKLFRTAYMHTENYGLTNLLVLGDTSLYTAYDGNPIFDDNRVLIKSGKTQKSNLLTGALTGTKLEEMEVNLMEMLNDDGTPFYRDLSNLCLMVGPSQKYNARRLLESDKEAYISDNQLNVFKGRYDIMVNPLLTGAYANYAILIDKTLMSEHRHIIRKYEWPFEVSDWDKVGDQQWTKGISYSAEYMPVFYQSMVLLKP